MLSLFALTAVACGSDDEASTANESESSTESTGDAGTTDGDSESVSLTVGVAAPLSGPYVALGESGLQGIELAVEQLEERGVAIDLVVEDTASDPQTTLNVFTKLTSSDDVDAILGTLCSACNTAATQVLEQAGIPQLTIGEGSSAACDASDLVICVIEDSASRTAAIEDAAASFGAEKVGIIQAELSAPGKEVTEALQSALPEAGIETQVAIAKADAQDFKAQLTSLSDSDMIVVAGAAAAQSGIVMRNAQDLGMEIPVVGLIWSEEILSAADESFVGEHYYFTAAFIPDDPMAADFVAAYEDAHGASPDKYAATGYTSTMLLGEAALNAASTDGADLRAAIDEVDIESPFGPPAIEDGVWTTAARIAQMKDGAQQFVD